MKTRRSRRKIFGKVQNLALLVVVLSYVSSWGETRRINSFGDRYHRSGLLEPRRVVDIPAAASLPRGVFEIDGKVYPSGGALAAVNIGITSRFMFGISYGAQNLVSDQAPKWNPRVEFFAKYKFFDETWYMPAIALGFESQGYGPYDRQFDRYTIKAKGFFGVVTKTYDLGTLSTGLSGGINYNPLEGRKDRDKNPSFFMGADARISNYVAFLGEYDFAFDDDSKKQLFGRGWGYFNLGVRWLFSESLWLEADFRDMFQNRTGVSSFGRELRLIYVESF